MFSFNKEITEIVFKVKGRVFIKKFCNYFRWNSLDAFYFDVVENQLDVTKEFMIFG